MRQCHCGMGLPGVRDLFQHLHLFVCHDHDLVSDNGKKVSVSSLNESNFTSYVTVQCHCHGKHVVEKVAHATKLRGLSEVVGDSLTDDIDHSSLEL